jgi:hypothetical protein
MGIIEKGFPECQDLRYMPGVALPFMGKKFLRDVLLANKNSNK